MRFVKSILIIRLRSSPQPWATGETGGRRPSVLTTPGRRDSSSRQGLRLKERHDWGLHLGGKWPRRSGWWHSSGWGQARVLWCQGSFYRVWFEVIRCRHCINSNSRSVESSPKYDHSGEWMSKQYCTSNSFLDGIRLRSEEATSGIHYWSNTNHQYVIGIQEKQNVHWVWQGQHQKPGWDCSQQHWHALHQQEHLVWQWDVLGRVDWLEILPNWNSCLWNEDKRFETIGFSFLIFFLLT